MSAPSFDEYKGKFLALNKGKTYDNGYIERYWRDEYGDELDKKNSGWVGDSMDALQRGAYSGGADFAQGVTGGSNNAVSNWLREQAAAQEETMTDEGLAEMQATGFDDNWKVKEGSTLKGAALQGLSGVGSFAPSMATGIGAGAVLKGVLGFGAKSIAASEVAGFAAAGGAMIGGGTSRQVYDEIKSASPEMLMEAEGFKTAYYDLIGAGVAHEQAVPQAIENFASSASEEAFSGGFALGAVSMGLTGRLMEKVMKGVAAKGRGGNALAGGATEFGQEYGEGAGQEYLSNKAMIANIDPDRDPMQNVHGTGLTGAVIGGGIGGGLGAATGGINTDDKLTDKERMAKTMQDKQNAKVAAGDVVAMAESAAQQARSVAEAEGGDALDMAMAETGSYAESDYPVAMATGVANATEANASDALASINNPPLGAVQPNEQQKETQTAQEDTLETVGKEDLLTLSEGGKLTQEARKTGELTEQRERIASYNAATDTLNKLYTEGASDAKLIEAKKFQALMGSLAGATPKSLDLSDELPTLTSERYARRAQIDSTQSDNLTLNTGVPFVEPLNPAIPADISAFRKKALYGGTTEQAVKSGGQSSELTRKIKAAMRFYGLKYTTKEAAIDALVERNGKLSEIETQLPHGREKGDFATEASRRIELNNYVNAISPHIKSGTASPEAITSYEAAVKSLKLAAKGWGHAPKQKKVPKKKASPNAVKSTDSMLTTLAKIGGVSRAEAEAQGIDPAEFKRKVGIRHLFNNGKKSLSMDGAAEALSQMGFDVTDGDGNYSANRVLEMISDSLSGTDHFTPEGHNANAEADALQRDEDRDLQFKDQLDALTERADEVGMGDAIRQAKKEGSITADNIYEFEQDVDDAAPAGKTEQAKGDMRDVLKSHSEADVKAKEDANKAADKKEVDDQRKQTDKKRADSEIDDFQLTGSDLPADANAKQDDVFGVSANADPAYVNLDADTGTVSEGRVEVREYLNKIDDRIDTLEALKTCVGVK